jgi:serine/threonine protein kinase
MARRVRARRSSPISERHDRVIDWRTGSFASAPAGIPLTVAKLAEQQVGRYAIFDRIAAGGMASVHLARLSGSEGFSRVVAVKRMHQHFAENPEFKRMFSAEARMAARIRHPNVVPTLDVLVDRNELVIVMDYVHGESLQTLVKAASSKSAPVPIPVLSAVMVSVLHGLHAAHEARDESGKPLGIIHRDVSPHNVLVGADGVARVLDFGVAKAIHAHQDTDPGRLKGKFSYMAPEVIRGEPGTRKADVFSAAVVTWELITGRKLFAGATDQERMYQILGGVYPMPSSLRADVPAALDRIVMKGLRPDPNARYASATEMAIELERETSLASSRVVGEWVTELAGATLEQRAELIHEIEASSVLQVVRQSMVPPERISIARPTVPVLPASARGGGHAPEKAPFQRYLPFAGVGFGVLGAVTLAVSLLRDEAPPPAAPAPPVATVEASLNVAPIAAPPEPKPIEPAPAVTTSVSTAAASAAPAPALKPKPKKKNATPFLPDSL